MSDTQNTQQNAEQPEDQITDEALESVAGGCWAPGPIGGGDVVSTIVKLPIGDPVLTVQPIDRA